MDLIVIHMTWVRVIRVRGSSHVNSSMHGCSASYVYPVAVVYATTETLTANRHMEYDLRQDPCVCRCQHLVTLVFFFIYYATICDPHHL